MIVQTEGRSNGCADFVIFADYPTGRQLSVELEFLKLETAKRAKNEHISCLVSYILITLTYPAAWLRQKKKLVSFSKTLTRNY